MDIYLILMLGAALVVTVAYAIAMVRLQKKSRGAQRDRF